MRASRLPTSATWASTRAATCWSPGRWRGSRPGGRLAVTGRHPALRAAPGRLVPRARAPGRGRRRRSAGASGPRARRSIVVKGDAGERRWQGAARAGDAGGAPEARAEPGLGPGRARRARRGGRPADRRPLVAARARLGRHRAAAVRGGGGQPVGPGDRGRLGRPGRPAVPAEVERAVVQLMTYLVENEQAALIIPARLLSQLHPHYREVMQLLATQAADEARHVEVFTRRAAAVGRPARHLFGRRPRLAADPAGRAGLHHRLASCCRCSARAPSSTCCGSSHDHAPDQVTADVTRLAVRDEARHVAFGVAHTAHLARADRQSYLGTLRQSVERRHAALLDTAGLNAEVFDALVLLAAGSWSPEAIRRGWQAVRDLQARMDEGRRRRLGLHRLPRRRGGGAVRPAHPQLHVAAQRNSPPPSSAPGYASGSPGAVNSLARAGDACVDN